MTYMTRVMVQFLTEPAPVLSRFYRQINQHVEERRAKNPREEHLEGIFEKLRDNAIEILCK